MLVTRQIAKETDPIGLQAVSGVMAVVVMVPVLLLGKGAQAITSPSLDSIGFVLMISIGLVGTAAHLLMTWSLRYATSATVAPMQYLEIPFATLLGFMIFNDLPNTTAGVGIVIITSAGLYVLLRERATALKLKAQAGGQPAE